MKKEKLFLLLLGLFMFNLSFAQRGQDRNALEDRRKAQFEKMVAALELSEDQVTEMKSINKEYGDKMRTMRRDDTKSREDIRANMKTMRAAQHAEIKDILTAEQFVKYENYQAEQRAQRPRLPNERRGGERRRTQGN